MTTRNAELLEEVKILEQDRALYVEKLASFKQVGGPCYLWKGKANWVRG
jgi:hypothetical protein